MVESSGVGVVSIVKLGMLIVENQNQTLVMPQLESMFFELFTLKLQ